MSEFDVSKSTTTDTVNAVSDYSVSARALDYQDNEKTIIDYPKSAEYFGYLKTIPELNRALWNLAIWVAGKGYEVGSYNKVILDHIMGWGEDSAQSIFENHIVVKKAIGDAFIEIVREPSEPAGKLINLKPISPERMRTILNAKGIIIGYEHRTKNGFKELKPWQVLHSCNDRLGDEQRGSSVMDVCKWVIDARQEALTDYRKVLHRNVVPVRIIEIDADNTVKRDALIREYEEAIKKGEVLVVPKGTVEIKENTINIQDPLAWIQSLENYFYQAVGISRVIATSQDYSEASSKVGYLTFEPVYTREQTLLEADIWNKLGIRIKFNRPASLGSTMQDSEQKNTGQTGFQPKDAAATITRE